MYQLVKGSIFDSKCDLIILPCNNWNGTSYDIGMGIKLNNLPRPKGKVEFGDVRFYETGGAFNNSFFVGYAASINVETNRSNEDALQRIIDSIYSFAKENSIQSINIPLLGTGAGKLEASLSFSILKKKFMFDNNVWLNIYTPDFRVYRALLNNADCHAAQVIPVPRVFVSYSVSDQKSKKWVQSLVDILRKNGVNARVDFYCLKAGYDLPQWMTNEIIQADKVILICDKNYAEKADIRKGGVGWETMIIQGDMLWHSSEQNKYIAIVRDESYDESIPIYMRSKYFFHWVEDSVNDNQIKELLYCIFDCDNEPPIGEFPHFIIKAKNRNSVNGN